LEYYAEDAYWPFRPTEERRWIQETSAKTLRVYGHQLVGVGSGHPASMSVPDTSLEFVDGVGVSAKSVHRKTLHPDQFFGVVALVTNMLSGVLGFPLQPIDGVTTRKIRPSYDLPSTQIQSPVS
jgi:hypothetical protein